MNIYTKIIAVVLLVCVLLSISACGDTNADSELNNPALSTEAPTTEAPTTEAPTTEAPTEEPTEDEEAIDFNRGNVDGNTYSNYLIGVSCALDDSWTISNEEQLAQQMGLASDFLGMDIDALIDQTGVAMIFMATRNDGASININLEKASSLVTTQEDLAAAVDTLATQLPAIFTSSGIEVNECVAENMTFCGEEHYGIHSDIGGNGISVYQRQVLLIRGTYIATITVTSTGSDETQAILDLFSTL